MAETTSYEAFRPLDCHSNQATDNPYPLGGFPPWVRDYISAVAGSYHVSAGMVGSAVLGCLATAVQAKYDVMPKPDHIEQLSLQIVIVAPSGSLKSPVLKHVFAPAYQYQDYVINKAADDSKDQQKSGQSYPTVVIDDCTPEALGIRLQQNNGRIGIVSAEGNIFAVLSGRYNKSPDYSILAKGYSGDPIRYDRVGRGSTIIPHPHVSCCIAMQPHVFASLVENADLDSQGIIARWCMADFKNPSTPRDYDSPSVDADTTHSYNDHMQALYSYAVPQNPIHLTLTADAYDLFCRLYHDIEETRIAMETAEENGAIVRWINKQAGCILRLAGLLHVSNDLLTTVITTAELTASAKLAEWYYNQAVRLLSSQDRVKSNALSLWAQMLSLRSDDNSVTYSHVTHDCCRNKHFRALGSNKPDYAAINDALDILVAHGYICIELIPTSGRTARVIHLSDQAIAASVPQRYHNC